MKLLIAPLALIAAVTSIGIGTAGAQEIAQPAASRSTASRSGISPIYAYAGRVTGPLNANAIQYYSYGGANGWGSPYHAAYYESGYYQVNACCRASQRLCTPFGGMAYGCKPGCYVNINPPCPTGYDSFRYGFLPPMPPSPKGGYVPEPMPESMPVAPDVKPDPQASKSGKVGAPATK
jgi:hypothetical protein